MSGIPNWAREGAKVVCINGASFSSKTGGWSPRTGGVYTIRSTFVADGHGWFIRLQEYVSDGVRWRGIEKGWDGPRFRPIISQQDDISAHFERLLDVPSDLEVA